MVQTPSDRGRTKGSVFASRLKFLRERGGEALVARVLEKLPKADREMLHGLVLAASC